MDDLSASPIGSTAEADDIHMGYMGRGEIIDSLNELIEAERAGTRTALALRGVEIRQDIRDFVRGFHAEETHWCTQLIEAVRRLGGAPSERCGDTYEKTMAISDPVDRLAFTVRGQRWLERKLDCLLPVIRDETLHAMLRTMRDGHRHNLGRIRQLVTPR